MLVAGGVEDQPAAMWIARGHAGNVWQLLQKLEHTKDVYAEGALSKDEHRLHKKILRVEWKLDPPPEYYEDDDMSNW